MPSCFAHHSSIETGGAGTGGAGGSSSASVVAGIGSIGFARAAATAAATAASAWLVCSSSARAHESCLLLAQPVALGFDLFRAGRERVAPRLVVGADVLEPLPLRFDRLDRPQQLLLAALEHRDALGQLRLELVAAAGDERRPVVVDPATPERRLAAVQLGLAHGELELTLFERRL